MSGDIVVLVISYSISDSMNMLKRAGLSTDPCITPLFIITLLSPIVSVILLYKHLKNSTSSVLRICFYVSRDKRNSSGTLLYAFLKSIKTIAAF